MAKAKKQEPANKPAPKKAPAATKTTPAPTKKAAGVSAGPAKKPAVKKPAKPDKSPAGGPRQVPRIDTGLAAAAAAAMVGNLGAAGLGSAATQSDAADADDALTNPAADARQESSTFKNLKESLNKPAMGGLGGILGSAGGQKKFNQGFGGPKQSDPSSGRNQTFGADVNRASVPRRTGGG